MAATAGPYASPGPTSGPYAEPAQDEAPPLFPARQRGRFTEAEALGIAARVRHAQLPWWERWFAPRPPTWEQTTDPYR